MTTRRRHQQQERGPTLRSLDWNEIGAPGCYVDELAGELIRIPQEAICAGSPVVCREAATPMRLKQLSDDPFLLTIRARLLCARYNIRATF